MKTALACAGAFATLFALLTLPQFVGAQSKSAADLIIRNAQLIDGTGAPPIQGDLAIAGDRIVAMGRVPGASAAREIDAKGRAVAPGFIDAHTHDDNLLLSDPAMTPKRGILIGISTSTRPSWTWR